VLFVREELSNILKAIPDAGTRARVSALARELEESEQRLSLALQVSQLGTWDWTPGGTASWDPRCKLLFGLRPDEDPTAEVLNAVVHPDDLERRQAAISRALDPSSGGTYQCIFRIVRRRAATLDSAPLLAEPASDERWVESLGRCFFDQAKTPVRFIGTVLDVSARQKAEVEAARRAEFDRQLVSIISHDLRNPLQTIKMSAANLERGKALEEKQLAAIDRIATAADRAALMVRDLLDFTRAKLSGGLPIDRKKVALETVVARAIDELHRQHPERAVRVEGSAGELLLDEERIEQLVAKLLSNAHRYGPPGSDLSVALAREGDAAVLRIHNSGEAISAELRKHLFEPQQGKSDRSIALGLYLSREIVRAHGGTIEAGEASKAEGAEKAEARGTTFIVRLPRT